MPLSRRVPRLAAIFFVTLCGLLVYHQHWIYVDTLWNNTGATIVPFSWELLPPSRSLDWQRCYPGRECARLIVPLNYSDPMGREAIIAIIRKPSTLSKDEVYGGPILFNPGGPGGSGVDLIRGGTGDLLSTIVGPRFDVVSFDPRGVGRSTPSASFFTTDVERALWYQGVKGLGTVNTSDEGIARTWAQSRVVGMLAAESDDGYLRHINTDNTARDMLSIVEASGREKIQYWGFSYGSILGATFAAMFPDKVDRLVIDGVVDSENYYGAFLDNNLRDTDAVMESFFTGCVEAGPHRCDFWSSTTEEIKKNITTLYSSVRSKPLPVRSASNYGVVDYSALRGAIFSALYSPNASFQRLAKGLADLAAGDGRIILDMHRSPPYRCSCNTPEPQYTHIREALAAVACNDSNDIPEDLEYSEEYFKAFSNISNWAELWAGVRLSCVGWPKYPKNHFQGPFKAKTSYPILLVGNTADPVTPLWAAKKMSHGFKDSVVLTQDSAGHCSIAAPSLCTQKYIRQYFTDGSLPKPGTVCDAIEDTFPGSPAEGPRQAVFLSSLSKDDREIFNAISELSKASAVGLPFLGINRRSEYDTEVNCFR
ncbi:hypothetical protein CVT26_012974 [Gymnopilus dilepis]|uniref:AB hydrolase-1 domain-containing protein n=1 Tax=Gymnopilus dilepis TaxID=231916 RepID=A0A409YP12_9AGAR|nr:hypothetical protein CVT26_012974 [Gymnopilus dilepis]